MNTNSKIYVIGVLSIILFATVPAVAGEFSAYYTEVDSGESFEQYSRTGPYADIVVEVGEGIFVFSRASSYLPYWETEAGP